jgi:kinase-associated protein B
MSEIQIGSKVSAHYNSGIYIGKIIEDRGDRYLVEVHAVQKHPMQGDLHHAGKAEGEGVLFHERKALAPREKMNVTKAVVYLFEDAIPEYNASLKQAVDEARERLREKNTAFSRKALEKIDGLETHFYKKYYER